MNNPLVVDASVASKWLVPEPDPAVAEQRLARPGPLHAPSLLLLEVANALWRKMRRRMLAEIEAQASLGWLHSLSLILWRGDESLAKALSLARRLDHTLYDCAYLALAQHVDARVVTADRRF